MEKFIRQEKLKKKYIILSKKKLEEKEFSRRILYGIFFPLCRSLNDILTNNTSHNGY